MNDKQMIEALANGDFINPSTIHCPCGVVLAMTRAFHKRTMNHDCVYHARNSCGSCRIVDRTLVQVEARLRAEV